MSVTSREGARAAVVAVAPAALLGAFIFHPYVGLGPPDEAAVAAAVVSEPTRWGLSHITAAVASALVVLAFLAMRSYLREAGEETSSAWAVPFIVMGSILFAMLPGMEFAPLAAAATGGDVEAAQAALEPWFLPVLLTGAVTFAVGVAGFARGIGKSAVLSPGMLRIVVGALVVMAGARVVPVIAVQFYVQGVAGIVALWPVAYEMWRQGEARPTEHPLPAASA